MDKQISLTNNGNGKKLSITDILKMISPGTAIRNAIDDLVKARLGALIVFDSDKLQDIIEGGFRINSRLTHPKLVELSKLDGAIIISADKRKILLANALLTPDKNIPSAETGTRHKAAERTAKHAETITIAVSERRNIVTIYYKEMKYALKRTEELISRATETLQILEKQREIYDSLIQNLNILEVTGLVTLNDVCNVLRRIETMRKISETIDRYVLELGKEGLIIKMRLKELTFNVDETREDLLKDYSSLNINKVKNHLSSLNFEELLDTKNMSIMLSSLRPEDKIIPRGYRMLKKSNLKNFHVDKLIKDFTHLENILSTNEPSLLRSLGNEAIVKKFVEEKEKLREKINLA